MTTLLRAEGQQTLAERLGYTATDRRLIIHADDAGMCHSANIATMQALEAGTVTCTFSDGAVLVVSGNGPLQPGTSRGRPGRPPEPG